MIDSHCHLDFKEFDGSRDKAVNEALSAGVHTIVNIGTDLPTSISSVALAERFECVYATVGVHPHDAKKFNQHVEDEIVKLIDNDKVVAVGEIGLDYYRDLSPRNIQKRVFRRQLDIAAEHKMPVVIHTRESFLETLEMVQEYASRLPGGIFHCFPGTVDDAYRVIDIRFHISVGGIITFPRAKMAGVAAKIPLEYILLETDSPYLAPVPYRGKMNQPAYVSLVAEKLADLRGVSLAEVEKITDRNCRKVYRLVETFGG